MSTTESSRATVAAVDAAEAVRTLNHATLHPNELTVGDVYRIVNELATATRRMRQTTAQLARMLEHHYATSTLTMDSTSSIPDAVVVIAATKTILNKTGAETVALADSLNEAAELLAHVQQHGPSPARSERGAAPQSMNR